MNDISTCNRIRIGNQTALAAGDPFAPFHFAAARGFDAFEWFADRKGERGFDFDLLDDAGRAWLREQGQVRDIRFSVHAPWFADPWKHDDMALRRSVQFAADIGAAIVVLHMNPEAPRQAFLQALTPAARMASACGVRLALENTVYTPPGAFNHFFHDADAPADVLAAIGMCFDMGHANLCPATMHDYVGYLDQLDAQVPIIHAHLHENFGDADTHLTLFTGPAATDDRGVREMLHRLEEAATTAA